MILFLKGKNRKKNQVLNFYWLICYVIYSTITTDQSLILPITQQQPCNNRQIIFVSW